MWDNPCNFGARASTAWVIAGSAVLGAGVSLYGSSQASKANDAAIAANKQSVADTNAMNYQRWLESQGVGADGKPINTWLPRYATLNSNFGKKRSFRKKGTPYSGASIMSVNYPMGNASGGNGIATFADRSVGNYGGATDPIALRAFQQNTMEASGNNPELYTFTPAAPGHEYDGADDPKPNPLN